MILVPYYREIDEDCEKGLKECEKRGHSVWRQPACSAIDVARNEMASFCVHTDVESFMFIDSDIGFNPDDVDKLFKSERLVISGVYFKKGSLKLASAFEKGTKSVMLG